MRTSWRRVGRPLFYRVKHQRGNQPLPRPSHAFRRVSLNRLASARWSSRCDDWLFFAKDMALPSMAPILSSSSGCFFFFLPHIPWVGEKLNRFSLRMFVPASCLFSAHPPPPPPQALSTFLADDGGGQVFDAFRRQRSSFFECSFSRLGLILIHLPLPFFPLSLPLLQLPSN